MALTRLFTFGCLLLCFMAATVNAQDLNALTFGDFNIDNVAIADFNNVAADLSNQAEFNNVASDLGQEATVTNFDLAGPTVTQDTGCSTGEFMNESSQCEACLSVCQTCEDGDTCTKCVEPGYFKDPPAEGVSGTCTRCPIGCDSCTTATTCDTCRDGWSDSDASVPCFECAAGCADCSGDKTSSTCTECDSGRYMSTTSNVISCVYSCPAGQYEEDLDENGDGIANPVCKDCPTGCESCAQVAGNPPTIQCFSCEENDASVATFLKDGDCVIASGCDGRTFADLESNLCAPCLHACATCSDGDSCDTCDGNYLLATGSSPMCVLNCEPGEWEDDSNNQCKECLTQCATCANDVECLSCTTQFYDPNSETDADKCVDSCSGATYERTITDGEGESKICSPCSPRCTACDNPSRNCFIASGSDQA